MADNIPLCRSDYVDRWGHIWTCELNWGHGIRMTPAQHSAKIPQEYQKLYPGNVRPYMEWGDNQ